MTRLWLLLLARAPVAALAVFVGLSLLAAAQLWDFEAGEPRLRVETAVDRILPDHDEERRFYDHFRARFGNDEVVLLVLIADDVLSARNLSRIERITARVGALDGVRRVVSVANALDVRASRDGIRVETFLERMPANGTGLEALRARVLGNPVYAGSLVSRDGRASVLVVYPDEMSETEFRRRGLDHAISRIAEEEKGDADVVLGGAPPVKAATSRLILHDAVFSASVGLAITLLVGMFAFRSAGGALLTLVCVGIGQLWALAAMAFLGRPLTLVTAVVPPVVNAVGIAYGMHVLSELQEVQREGFRARAAVFTAVGRVASPVLLCALTTIAGFLSLCTSNLAVIREFGLFCSVGTAACLAAALWLLPCLIALRPPRAARSARPSRLPALAARIASADLRWRGRIFAAAAALALLAGIGATRIEVSTSLVHNFSEDHPLRVGFARMDRHLGGSNTLNVVIDAGRPDAFKTPGSLRELVRLQRWLETQPEVGHTTSIADYAALIHRALRGDDPAELRVPDSERLVEQLFYFFWDEQLERFVDDAFASATVEVRVRAMDSSGYAALVDRIDERLRALPSSHSGRITGNTVLVVRAIDDIARSQATSLAAGLLSIGALLVVYFRSLRVGLLALVPNVLPVLVYFGALGLSGVTLNPTTSLVACLVLGVAVDDTLHYLARFRGFVASGYETERAVVEALRSVARPVALTTVVLCGQLLVLTTSELRHQVEFGALAAGTLAFAALLDVTLTPALAASLAPRAGRGGARGPRALALLVAALPCLAPAAPSGESVLAQEPPELVARLRERGLVVLEDVARGGPASFVIAYVLFAQPRERAIALVTDPTRQTEWRADLEEVRVVESASTSRVDEIRMRVLFRELVYRVRYDRDPESDRIAWTLDARFDNDLERFEGFWEFYALDGAGTLGRFGTRVDAGIAIPAFMQRDLTRRSVVDTMESCRKWVDSGGSWRR